MNRPLTAVLALTLGAPSVALLVSTVACDDKKPSTDTARADASAGVDKYATADPKLEKALAAASASAATQNGPPPDGIFAAGVADTRHAKGAPTKVDVVSDGSDPKVSLQSSADASADAARATSYGPAILEYVMQQGQRPGPVIDFAMVLGPPKKDEGGPDTLVSLIKQASPAREQMGQLPPGFDKQFASLEGSSVRMNLTPDGRASDIQVQLSKGGNPDLALLVTNAAEALFFATVPMPPKPVGVGAQWIAETRMPLSGLDVIAYRAYHVDSIDGDRLSLTMTVKAYAASKDVALQGVPKGANLVQFDTESEAKMQVVRGEALARKADMQQVVVLVFEPPGGAPQPKQGQPQDPQQGMLQAQLQSKATFLRGEDLKNELKH